MNRRDIRRLKSNTMVGLMVAAVLVAVLPLLLILGSLIVKGAGSLSIAFFTRMPVPAGETGGGVLNAIVGTLMIVGMASARRRTGWDRRRASTAPSTPAPVWRLRRVSFLT